MSSDTLLGDQRISRKSNKLQFVRGKRNGKSQRRRASIKIAQESYTDSLTVHGLSRILLSSRLEKVFWSFALLSVLSIAAYLCTIYVTNYYKHEVQTKRKINRMLEMPLPAILICKYTICFDSKEFILGLGEPTFISNSCLPIDLRIVEGNATTTRIGNECILWNAVGEKTLRHPNLPVVIKIELKEGQQLHIYQIAVGDPDMLRNLTAPLFTTHFHSVNCLKDVSLEKTVYKRLPSSNCSNGEGIENYFSNIYSKEACIQSCFLRKMSRKCGAVIDSWKKYTRLLKVEKKVQLNNKTLTLTCVSRVYGEMLSGNLPINCKCPERCDEIKYDEEFIYPSLQNIRCPDIKFDLRYRTHEFKYIEEVVAYTLSNLAADIGSIVGSLAGISVLSVVEIVVFMTLSFLFWLT